jgi:biopolymer transport protein ExbD
MNINLPKGTTDQIKREQTRTLSVNKQGRVYLNDVSLTPAQLRGELARLAKVAPPITILVKADEANNYGAVMEVLKELHAAKITRIALMTQEETPPRLVPIRSGVATAGPAQAPSSSRQARR